MFLKTTSKLPLSKVLNQHLHQWKRSVALCVWIHCILIWLQIKWRLSGARVELKRLYVCILSTLAVGLDWHTSSVFCAHMFAHVDTVTVRGRVAILSDWLLAEVKCCVKGHLRRCVAGDAALCLAFPIHHIFYFYFPLLSSKNKYKKMYIQWHLQTVPMPKMAY